MTAIISAFAKINLSLEVLGRRADGYHELRTIFQTISLCDALHFDITESGVVQLTCNCSTLETDERNLVVRAARALQRVARSPKGVKIHLEKLVPMGAGLGGGSGDAGATLLALRRLWNVEVADSVLDGIAASLGADVPFFLQGGTGLGIGRGDIIEPLPDADIPPLIIVDSGVVVPTGLVFSDLNMALTTQSVSRILPAFPNPVDLRRLPGNDLEEVVFKLFPVVEQARDALLRAGAMEARMSGSGGSVFGFFENDEVCAGALRSLEDQGWRSWKCQAVSRSEYQEKSFAVLM